jgi:hypothetical protein
MAHSPLCSFVSFSVDLSTVAVFQACVCSHIAWFADPAIFKPVQLEGMGEAKIVLPAHSLIWLCRAEGFMYNREETSVSQKYEVHSTPRVHMSEPGNRASDIR